MRTRLYSTYPDEPRSLRDVQVKAERRELLLKSQHMTTLAEYVAKIRQHDRYVPDFDPLDGGDEAQVLFLLEKPGPKTFESHGGSGFISRNNDDPTARNIFNFMSHESVSIPRESTIIWNTIPWWNGTIALAPDEIKDGINQVHSLIELLPALHAVVLVGKQSQKVRDIIEVDFKDIGIFNSYHPSGRNHKYHTPIISVWSEVSTFLNTKKSSQRRLAQ